MSHVLVPKHLEPPLHLPRCPLVALFRRGDRASAAAARPITSSGSGVKFAISNGRSPAREQPARHGQVPLVG